MGEITILPNHAALVATLATGELVARTKGGQEHNIHVAGGFVEVKDGNKIIILADGAEHHHEIDELEAEAAKQRAEETLKQSNISGEEYALAAAALERSVSKLHIVRKYRHRSAPQVASIEKDISGEQ
jgi:F-type H+-transporting ATPase subunit epsilon